MTANGVPGLTIAAVHCKTAADGYGVFAEAAFAATGTSNTNAAIK